jgi:NhaP-type Na+/H+ or K+/H+ antiporter
MAMKAAGMPLGPGNIILAIAVLSIIVTAPAGAWLINLLGDKILVVAPESFNDAYESAIESNPDSD